MTQLFNRGSKWTAVSLMAAGAFAATSSASPILQIDLNSLTVDAGGPFGGLTHTGTLSIGDDGTTSFASILIDGTVQPANPEIASMKGSIDLANGQVTGGSLAIAFMDGSMYTTMLAGTGDVDEAANPGGAGPGPFTIDALTEQGSFSGLVNGNEFGGVDVTDWLTGEPLFGSLLTFKFGPDASGFDGNADMDVFVGTVVPMPPAAMAGMAGLLGAASLRRRLR